MKAYVLWTRRGPVAVGDLDALKVRAEKMATKIVGDTQYKWEPVAVGEDDDWASHLGMHRRSQATGRWLQMPYIIDEVPVVATKKKAGT
ncbi:hypothetical protein [Streptomyces sp. NPDC058252]|uniref:hypothetical protein n=1 Tax=Streptomyces sp. NPDC058252 TaxID=3346405 RepID=UPI0036EBA7B9